MYSLEHEGNIYSNHQSRSKFEKETESNKSSSNEETLDEKPVKKKKAVKEKPQKITKMVNEGAKKKNTKRRSASVDRLELVEKAIEKAVSKSRKRTTDKEVPTMPVCDQPLKRNRRAASIDILSSESSLPVTKKTRKGSATDKVEVNKPKTTKKAVKATVKKTLSKKKVVPNNEVMVDSEDPELTDVSLL